MTVWIILVGLVALVLGCSLRIVPFNPPQVAVVTVFGRPTRTIRRSGLGFFLFYPHIMGEILIPLTPRPLKFLTPVLMSRDSAQVTFEVNLTWAPSEVPAQTLVYADVLIRSGPVQVEERIRDTFVQQLRPWAMATDWRSISSESAFASAARICLVPFNINPDALHEFLSRNTPLPIPSLGIVLQRLNLTDVRLSDDLIRAAEMGPKNAATATADWIRLSTLNDWIKKTMADLGCGYAEAADLIHTQLGVVPKSVTRTEVRLDVLSSEQLATLLEWVCNRPNVGRRQ